MYLLYIYIIIPINTLILILFFILIYIYFYIKLIVYIYYHLFNNRKRRESNPQGLFILMRSRHLALPIATFPYIFILIYIIL